MIGTSVQGRPIVAVHRWHPGATRTLLVIGNLHGDEKAGLRVVHRLRKHGVPAGRSVDHPHRQTPTARLPTGGRTPTAST